MSAHPHTARCSSCHRDTVVRANPLWKLALVGGYFVLGVMVFCAALLGPTIMAVLPLLAATGMGLLPFLHERAGAPPECSACGKYQPADETVEVDDHAAMSIELTRAA